MSIVMKGLDVAAAMKVLLTEEVKSLTERGIKPCLTIVRVGTRPDDLAYERGARKRLESVGVKCCVVELPEKVSQKELEDSCRKANEDKNIHGILLFRPLPSHLDEGPVMKLIEAYKDVDCLSTLNMASVFMGEENGFAPCTASAVMEMLDFYNVNPEGKKVVIIGRSMVVGRPLSMLLLKRNATVTICHTKTKDLEKVCREADILVAAAGKIGIVTENMVREGAVVVDVGINVDHDGNLCGDVDYKSVNEKVSYISPVPGGVGSITSSVLAKHVILAARMQNI